MGRVISVVATVDGVDVLMTSPRARVAGVNRAGTKDPVGVMHKIPGRRAWSCMAYRVDAPFDMFVGVADTVEEGASLVAPLGQTPEYLKKKPNVAQLESATWAVENWKHFDWPSKPALSGAVMSGQFDGCFEATYAFDDGSSEQMIVAPSGEVM